MIWRAPEGALPIFGELSMRAEENTWRAAARIEENERERGVAARFSREGELNIC